ncbi:hypothetical protein C8A05DRAFT_39006 [Staphylotrichum tortipilum]|uniref:Uncharacterized protein n=1 Tax=Staphylotrichum tortipilum TaxID=2831512 RepID=A0AAN6MBK4_9PEZI|nr:hypothetical protein C8A05DRAFT_39006 [Staphylotrichum longicolle]
MDFIMDIDTTTNRRKRCRADDDEAELGLHHLLHHDLHRDHVAKRARQLDASTPALASTPAPPSDYASPATPSMVESGPSTPASSIDMEMDDVLSHRAPEPKPQVQPQPQIQRQVQPQCQPPSSQGTIISGWNQNQRNRYLRQGYPLSWMQGSTQH